LFREKETGSLEAGKLADFIMLDTDLLSCAAEAIPRTQVLRTYLGGKLVYARDDKSQRQSIDAGAAKTFSADAISAAATRRHYRAGHFAGRREARSATTGAGHRQEEEKELRRNSSGNLHAAW
ncbi:MAG: amidohydrolase family protein, partial [Verrucomicrobia bacterium]|nr:amidohydrolase family protein [Verrucomicrobiota bacterium]